jgi:predicted alpha-1,2-mannosidase
MGSPENRFDKDKRWWSAPYENRNKYFTGFSHVNLSGVGCPDMGSLLLMPAAGELDVDYRNYGSLYEDETASPGYYSNRLVRYGILTEATAAMRSGAARFTFPAGQANILLNLGEGLTNESGAFVRSVSDTEIEGMKLLGTFCYNPQAVFPIYFVMRVDKTPSSYGFWKKQRPAEGPEADWDPDQGKYKLYTKYHKDLAGDDIGAWFTFDAAEGEQIEVRMGVSFVSVENARLNLDMETDGKSFDGLRLAAREEWNGCLSRILVEGGTEEQKSVFYTALYHTLIHPNILQDVDGEYPAMEGSAVMTAGGNRYTVFSLWDTYRNLHQLMTLAYPEKQEDMIRSMLDMYRESGWLPKWELYGRETLTMEGDPAIPVIVDTYLKGFRYFDAELAWEAMYKSATTPGEDNPMRPDNDDYMRLGYVPLREENDNSVSHALEYYIADHALSRFAAALGKKDDAEIFRRRSLGYRNYYSPEYGTFRPKLPDGRFVAPFDPAQGANFEPNPGFHEGSAWNYTFYVPHDIAGLAKLMGGKRKFVDKLEMVFSKGYYDPANEPDIAYPYLFSYFPGEEWRTQYHTRRLLGEHFKNTPGGIPGNDDAGTMSAWAVFSMMGFYPDCPGEPYYTLTSPVFDRVTIKLDERYYPSESIVIEAVRPSAEAIYIESMELGGKKLTRYRVSHDELVGGGKLTFKLTENK